MEGQFGSNGIDGIRVTRFDNGLTVATDPMPGIETAAIGVWVGVGTRHEPAAINGVAHLLEHMAFKGTQRRSARDISVEIESVGGHLNAYTSRENTAYYARVLADDVPLALEIIADILQHSTFDETELARERAVVLQEIGQAEDTPDDIVFDYFQATAYPGQALGRRVLGTADIVGNLARDAIRGYMREHYTGERLILCASGKVDHRQLVDLAAKAFVDLPRASFGPTEEARYVVRLTMQVEDRRGILADVSAKVADINTNITSVEATTDQDQRGRIDMTVEISDLKHLEKVMKSLKSVEGVIGVERAAAR